MRSLYHRCIWQLYFVLRGLFSLYTFYLWIKQKIFVGLNMIEKNPTRNGCFKKCYSNEGPWCLSAVNLGFLLIIGFISFNWKHFLSCHSHRKTSFTGKPHLLETLLICVPLQAGNVTMGGKWEPKIRGWESKLTLRKKIFIFHQETQSELKASPTYLISLLMISYPVAVADTGFLALNRIPKSFRVAYA